MTQEMTEAQRAVLRAVCDTVVPPIERAEDPDGFWARTATDLGVDQGVEQLLAEMPEDLRGGLIQLLDVLDAQGFLHAPPSSRASRCCATSRSLGPEAAAGVARAGRPDPLPHLRRRRPRDRPEPELADVRLPGPDRRAAASAEADRAARARGRRARRSRPTSCIVGSGAGGGVIAGTLAQQGPEGRRARGGRLLQRGRLQPARARGPTRRCTGAAARRRPPTSTSRCRPAPTLGGGTVDQLDQLPAHHAVGARAVGARARARGRRRPRVRPPPRRRAASASRRPTAAPT